MALRHELPGYRGGYASRGWMRIGSWWFVSEIDEPGSEEDEEDDQRDHEIVWSAAALVSPPDETLDRLHETPLTAEFAEAAESGNSFTTLLMPRVNWVTLKLMIRPRRHFVSL